MMTGALLVLSISMVVAASLHDLVARTIPNWQPIALACIGAALATVAGHFVGSSRMAAAVFVICALCWRHGWLGGGDVKLLGAASLCLPPDSIPLFVAAVAMSGGALAFVYLAVRQILPSPARARPRGVLARALRAEKWRIRRGGPLPYACAIAAGFLFVTL